MATEVKVKEKTSKLRLRSKLIIIFTALAVIVIIAGLFIGNSLYNLALNPLADKSAITESYEYDAENDGKFKSSESISWFENSGRESVYIEAFDGIKLHGQIIAQPTDKWAIVAHGYLDSGDNMVEEAMRLYNMGYNILLPDARGHGDSEGDYVGLGWHERLDYLEWIDMIISQRSPDAQIIIYGQSMGAATAMMVSGEDLPENVKAIVEDCGYSDVNELFKYLMDAIFGLPSFPILNFASLVTHIRADYWLGEASPIRQLENSRTPTMFIHGSEDTFIPVEMVYELYDAADVEKELYIVQGAGHIRAAEVAGDKYWQRVESFLSNHVK